MKRTDTTEILDAFKSYHDSLAQIIIGSLDITNSGKKLEARSTLVGMGKEIIARMHKLLESESDLLRMEAAKIVELIADRKSIPLLIKLLDDKEFEIRWIASEGLIKIGRRSILPLLKSIRNGKSSFFLNKGAHHVLIILLKESEKDKLMSLLHCLDDSHGLSGMAPVEASMAIEILYKRTNQS